MATTSSDDDSRRPEGEQRHQRGGHNISRSFIQNKRADPTPGSSSEVHGRVATTQEFPIPRPLVLSGSQHDIIALLNPILDASHTRNRKVSGPNSACFPGTRQDIIKVIRTWMNSSLIFNDNPHIMWIYGYAGCGKSAIAQEVAEYFAGKGQLVASFFFFRGSGDRSSIARFAVTVASQVASTISGTASIIEEAVTKNRGLLTTATSTVSTQFQQLVYDPINGIRWEKITASLRGRPFLIVLDGLDECGDQEEVAAFVENMTVYFAQKPRTPLRVLITSRVESHIHQCLHSSDQVRLLDLVDHTSDSDIAAALDIAIEKEKRRRLFVCAKDWPSAEEKAQLVKHIGGSYIFMTTIIRLLFDPNINHGLTPMDRLPLVLSTRPDFDALYEAILSPWQHLPHFHDIISTIALALEPISVSQIADLLEVGTPDVVNALINLHAIMQIPGDDHAPVALWHTSLRDFLCSQTRSKSLHAPLAHHRCIAYKCITLSASFKHLSITKYSRRFALDHWISFMQTTEGNPEMFCTELSSFIIHLQNTFPGTYRSVLSTYFKRPPQTPSGSTLYDVVTEARSWDALQPLLNANTDIGPLFPDFPTELEIAARAHNWKAVRHLVNTNTDVNGLFHHRGIEDGIFTALHAACRDNEVNMIYFLLESGADPNVISPKRELGGFWHGTPLAFAAYERDVKLVTRLLECGAKPNLQGGRFDTALQAACRNGSLEVANLLLDNRADPNLRGGYWESALHACAVWDHESCVQALLLHKADPDIRDGAGDTPLHRACLFGNSTVVQCLLEFKADASIKNKKGQTALQLAQDGRQEQVVALLLRHGVAE